MSSRHRPLLACMGSILAMADIASRKAQDHLHGHLGSTFITTAKLVKLMMSPLIYAMKYQCLIIIFFLDYQFMAIEKMIELFCPNSISDMFNNKVEEIVLMIESLPKKFDNVVEKLLTMVYQFSFSFRQWSLVHLISCLNCLISTLNQMEPENPRMKGIAIDQHLLQLVPPESSDSLYTIESFSSATQCFPGESYKDVGKILDRIDYDEGSSESEENNNYIDKAKESSGSIVKFRDIGMRVIEHEPEHPILQLFESNWLSN